MEHQRGRLSFLRLDDDASALHFWKKLTPLGQMADVEECLSLIKLELEQTSIRIAVIREQVEYIQRMRELDDMSGNNVLRPYFDPDPEEPGDNGHSGRRA